MTAAKPSTAKPVPDDLWAVHVSHPPALRGTWGTFKDRAAAETRAAVLLARGYRASIVREAEGGT